MDVHLFQNLVPQGVLPEDGPQNRLRMGANINSIWYNGPHEAFLPCPFEDYLEIRGWNKEKLLVGQWRSAHADNHSKSDRVIVLDSIAVIQSWLTLGFLEMVFQTRIPVDKYTRPFDDAITLQIQQTPSFEPIL